MRRKSLGDVGLLPAVFPASGKSSDLPAGRRRYENLCGQALLIGLVIKSTKSFLKRA
jgi:hypothetical protein